MNCIECNSTIENGTYFCEYCGAAFSEEEVQVMLHIEHKRIRKKLKKELFLVSLIFLLIIAIGVGLFTYADKKFKDRVLLAKQDYFDAIEQSLSKVEGVLDYDYDEYSINLYVDKDEWLALSDTQKQQFAIRMQNAASKLRQDSGINNAALVTLQVNIEDEQMVLFADSSGRIQIFEISA